MPSAWAGSLRETEALSDVGGSPYGRPSTVQRRTGPAPPRGASSVRGRSSSVCFFGLAYRRAVPACLRLTERSRGTLGHQHRPGVPRRASRTLHAPVPQMKHAVCRGRRLAILRRVAIVVPESDAALTAAWLTASNSVEDPPPLSRPSSHGSCRRPYHSPGLRSTARASAISRPLASMMSINCSGVRSSTSDFLCGLTALRS